MRFVVVGDFAGAVYGYSLVERGVEVCCEFAAQDLFRLQDAIADLHPAHRMNPKKPALGLTEANCKDYKNLYLDTDLGQLHCLGHVQRIGDYADVNWASRQIRVRGLEFKVLTLESLIEAKKAMGRPHDMKAVAELAAIRRLGEG